MKMGDFWSLEGKLVLEDSNENKLNIHVHDKMKNEWTRVEQKGTEWQTCYSQQWSMCHGHYKDNTIVFWREGSDNRMYFIREIWLFNTETLIFKRVAIASSND